MTGSSLSETKRKEVAARALGLVDLTDLSENCNHEAIDKLCARAQTPYGNVGAICIWPRYVAHARKVLRGTDIPIATVVNFPGGNQSIDMTVSETRAALDDGADEIDLVMPYQAFAKGDDATAKAMIVAVRTAVGTQGLLKVIIESGELESDALITQASLMAIAAGADFIKTSTGKVAVNATLHTAELMIKAIADSTNVEDGAVRKIGFKPAGGIKTTEDCAAYLAIADRFMGPSWVSPATFRFGASSVLDDLLAAMAGSSAQVSDDY